MDYSYIEATSLSFSLVQEEMEELPKLLVDAIDQDLQEQPSQKKDT